MWKQHDIPISLHIVPCYQRYLSVLFSREEDEECEYNQGDQGLSSEPHQVCSVMNWSSVYILIRD